MYLFESESPLKRTKKRTANISIYLGFLSGSQKVEERNQRKPVARNRDLSVNLFFPNNHSNQYSSQYLQHVCIDSGHYTNTYFILTIYIQVSPQCYRSSAITTPICSRGSYVQIKNCAQGHILTPVNSRSRPCLKWSAFRSVLSHHSSVLCV